MFHVKHRRLFLISLRRDDHEPKSRDALHERSQPDG